MVIKNTGGTRKVGRKNVNYNTSDTFILLKKKRVNWAVTEEEKVKSQIPFLC